MSADSLLHLAYLLLICAVSAVWSQAARRKAPLRRGSWTLLGSLSVSDVFPSLATFLSVVTLGRGEYLPWVIYKGRRSTARPSCRWLLMLPQMLSHQVVEERRGCSAAADDRNGPVFLAARLCEAIYDHDISIPSHSRIVNEVSGGLRAARCSPHTSSSKVLHSASRPIWESCETLRLKRRLQIWWTAVEALKHSDLNFTNVTLQLHDYRRGPAQASGWTLGRRARRGLGLLFWSVRFYQFSLFCVHGPCCFWAAGRWRVLFRCPETGVAILDSRQDLDSFPRLFN